jgi:uncharacterized LabA/DUF88 family protein
VVLATGDGDFVPLVEYLKTHSGCQVEVVAFGKSSSSRLKEVVDDFIDMDADPKTYLINYRSQKRTASTKRRPDRTGDRDEDLG